MDEEIEALEKSGATETAAKLREKWNAHKTQLDTLKAEHSGAAKKLSAADKELAKYKADLDAAGKGTDERLTKLQKVEGLSLVIAVAGANTAPDRASACPPVPHRGREPHLWLQALSRAGPLRRHPGPGAVARARLRPRCLFRARGAGADGANGRLHHDRRGRVRRR